MYIYIYIYVAWARIGKFLDGAMPHAMEVHPVPVVIRKTDSLHHHHHHHHHSDGVVYRIVCLNSSTVAVSEIVSRRWWCTEFVFPSRYTRATHRCTCRGAPCANSVLQLLCKALECCLTQPGLSVYTSARTCGSPSMAQGEPGCLKLV